MVAEAEPRVAVPLAGILPLRAEINERGHLTVGGCDVVELVSDYGTPLYVFDEDTIRFNCREFVEQFSSRYRGEVQIVYAAKAYAGLWISNVVREEGLGMDVVSGGELHVALHGGFPADRIYFHGNNKSSDELNDALKNGVARIVVNGLEEFYLLEEILEAREEFADVLLRVNPATFHADTHGYTTTGIANGKFGLEISNGDEVNWERIFGSRRIRVAGLHMHLGSPIWSPEPYRQAITTTLELAADLRTRYGFSLDEFSPGGGYPIQYTSSTPAPSLGTYAEAIGNTLEAGCQRLGFERPKLIVEPGRAIVGRAGVALYTVGVKKIIEGLRSYVAVDGGMADNIRPMLYDASYEALVANKLGQAPSSYEYYRIIGPYCESGDVVIPEIRLPELKSGDILAIPAAGAYSIPMASNYNCARKPAIVAVRNGSSFPVRRRETIDDLVRTEVEAREG